MGRERANTGQRHIIERPRLMRVLDRATARTISLVAPAGYGKTTLARQWLNQAGRTSAWYQADASASDVVAFSEGIASAIEQVVPGAAGTMRTRARLSDGSGSDSEVLAELLAQGTQAWPTEAWLGIDDYHLAMQSQPSERFLDRLVTTTNINVLLTSRRRPAWASARRLLYGDVLEIGQSQLAMDSEETAAVLASARAEPLPGLVGLADGWPAVIGLASHADRIDLPDDAVAEELYGFLAQEILESLDPEHRSALELIALLPTITDESAAAITGVDARHALSAGVTAGILNHRQPHPYEMHPLWREVLVGHLSGHERPSRKAVRRTTGVFLARRAWDDAFALAVSSAAGEELERVVDAEMDALLSTGRLATIADHISSMRKVVESPIADLADAEVLFRQGEHGGATALALRAATQLPVGHPRASRAFFRAAQAAYFADEPAKALELGAQAEAVATLKSDLANASYVQYLAALELENDAIESLAKRVRRTTSDEPGDILRVAATGLLQDTRLAASPNALGAGANALCFVDRAPDPLVRTAFLNALARSYACRMEYERAISLYTRGVADAETMRLDFALLHFYLGLSNAHIGLGDYETAGSILEKAKNLASDAHTIGNWQLVSGRLALAQRRFGRAAQALARPDAARDPATRAELNAYGALTAACQGRRADAIRLARLARETSSTVEPTAISSLARFVVDRDGHASERLRRVVRRIESRGHPDFLLIASRASERLAVGLRSLRGESPMVDSVLQRLGRTPSRPNLTRREREILRLLAMGLRNREIAARLVISEVTVKVHVRHILEKTGTRSRTEAAVFATQQALDA